MCCVGEGYAKRSSGGGAERTHVCALVERGSRKPLAGGMRHEVDHPLTVGQFKVERAHHAAKIDVRLKMVVLWDLSYFGERYQRWYLAQLFHHSTPTISTPQGV